MEDKKNLCYTPDRNQSEAVELMDQYPNAASWQHRLKNNHAALAKKARD